MGYGYTTRVPCKQNRVRNGLKYGVSAGKLHSKVASICKFRLPKLDSILNLKALRMAEFQSQTAALWKAIQAAVEASKFRQFRMTTFLLEAIER